MEAEFETEVVITKSKKVIVNQRLIGSFQKVQEEIIENALDIVKKHRVKTKHLGNNKFRYIGDWEQIIREYHEIHGFKKQNGGAKRAPRTEDPD